MSKAIQGAAEIGLAVGFFAISALVPGAGVLVASVVVDDLIAGIGLMGVGMEAGAIAQALAGNRGENITIRQPASPRQIIYGTQRVGGVITFLSTTGSSKDQFNFIIAIAGHELWAIQNLYLDGRQVYWHGAGTDWQVRNGYGFGAGADGLSHLGPTGNYYTFNNASTGHSGVYAAARYGDQVQGDYIASLTANDGRWGPSMTGDCPSMVGCAYIYLKVEYDPNLFPQQPEVKLTVKGKAVYDPRTGLTAYSENPALIIADYIGDTEFGLGDNSVNQEQLIAAANICDELVAYSGGGGGTESRYSCNYHFDTSTAPGDVIQTMLATCGGRLSRIGGEWYIWPATYIAPSASFGPDSLVDKPSWSSKRSYRDLCNVVQGVYTAPNYPYSAATAPGSLSDLYDSNGYYNGETANNFPFAFQSTSYPAYQQDTLHGYSSNQYLTEDGGVVLPRDLNLPACLSISQAQRLAKIELMRNRQQGSGKLIMGPEGFNLQPCDTFLMTFPQRGWADKLLEVNSVEFIIEDSPNGGAPLLKVAVGVNETDPSVYDWSPSEELTVLDVPAAPNTLLYDTAPPTNMALTSSAATALLQKDGTLIPRIEVTWDTPADIRVTQIAVRYRTTGTSLWIDAGLASVTSNSFFIAPVIAGQEYDVAIASRRSNGATSDWVEIDGFTAGLVLNFQTQDGLDPGSLRTSAYTDGTASITCEAFTALIGQVSLSMFPSGPVTLTGLAQQTLYYIYYIDMTCVGGDVTPIATTNRSDFLGKLGYFYIGSIVTPYAGTGGGSTPVRYLPTNGVDYGSSSSQNIDEAFDNNVSTYATVTGNATETYLPGFGGSPPDVEDSSSNGDLIIGNFQPIILVPASTLYVNLFAGFRHYGTGTSTAGTVKVRAIIAGAASAWTTVSSSTPTNVTFGIPANTDISTVYVEIAVDPGSAAADATHVAASSITEGCVVEVYIQ